VSVLILVLALGLLMTVAYRGFSVVVGAPLCALLAVLLALGPKAVLPMFSGLFMKAMVGFIALYLPVFLLGALFGKMMELTGAAAAISAKIVSLLGEQHTIGAVVLACAVLTYGGVSLFVVAFAVYPFAKALFKRSHLHERLIPGTIALGSFTFTMDALPGTPQIQNVIPTTFFGTNLYAAPILGICGATFVLTCGMLYLERRKRKLGPMEWPEESEAEEVADPELPSAFTSFLPLLTVAVVNFLTSRYIAGVKQREIPLSEFGIENDVVVSLDKMGGLFAIEVALVLGLVVSALFGFVRLKSKLHEGMNKAVAGATLAALNTGSEYGFGAVIASLPGFIIVKQKLVGAFSNPLINEAVSVNLLAGITGSASGGMSIALAAMADNFKEAALAADIDFEVLHRVASMASGGMDTLPHNGAVITLLMITGMTHKQSYGDIFAITCIKTVAVFVIIGIYSVTGLV
jgi:H+/gluconate symporter-like permease